MKTYVKVVLFFVFFIVVSAILAALYFYNLKHTDMSKAHPDFVITATALLKEFEDNETSASANCLKPNRPSENTPRSLFSIISIAIQYYFFIIL